jgi:uncharacterized membrane protein
MMAGEPESLHTNEPLRVRVERHNYDRLLMLSDGVFAIAITLLALELKVPAHWDGSVEGLFGATGRPLIGYLFGFTLVGVFWFLHRRLFAELEQVDGVITLLNLVLLGLVGLTPFVVRMIAEAGAGRALPFYLIAVGAVFASVALIHAWVMFRPRLFHAGVDRSAFRMTAFFQAVMAIAFVALGSWALWQRRPVDGTLFSTVVIILAVAQRMLRRRRRRRLQTSSTSRP